MRISVIVAAAIILTAVAYKSWMFVAGDPGIVISPEAIELGAVSELEEISTSVWIANKTRRPYELLRIESTCPCSTVALESWPLVLKPGSRTSVPVVYRTQRGDGHRVEQLAFLLRDPEDMESRQLVKIVPVSCQIVPELRAEPASIDMGAFLPHDEQRTARFRVVAVSGNRYSVTSAETTSSQMVVEGPDSVGAEGAEFVVSFDPKGIVRNGTIAGTILMRLSGERVTDFRIPFKAIVMPQFTLAPDVVVFPADAAIGAAVSVEMRSQSPFRVSAINAPESVMALCSDGTRFLLSHELVVTLQQPVARPPDLGVITLTLSTENGTSQTLSVKVHYARSFPEARRND